jgi:tetratricopeptide (TPR) repeat protein
MTMDRGLEHAQVLLRQGRPDLAERSLREHLAQSPDDAWALALLALTQVQREQYTAALDSATSAIGGDPDLPLAQYVRALALDGLGRFTPALEAAREVVRLAPDSPLGFQALTVVWASQRRWNDVLQAADQGLAVDPDDPDLINARGVALTQLGRRHEASETFVDALRTTPTHAGLLTGQGLAKLHQGHPEDAMEAFREALRIEPGNEAARFGLVEAMKARNPLYAVLLAGMLAFSRLGTRGQILVIVGFLIMNRVIRGLAADPETRTLGFILLAAYLTFVWLTFAASSLFDLLLRLDPLGRHALTSEQVTQANLVGALVAIGIPAGALALITQAAAPAFLAVLALGLVVPLDNVFEARPGRLRWAMIAYTLVVVLLGGTAVALALADALAGVPPGRERLAEDLFFWMLLAIAAATWLSWPIAMRSR